MRSDWLPLIIEIVKVIDREDLTVRAAQRRTGIAAADFSRIRNADLGRFTVDRLISILNRLGARVDGKIRVRAAGRLAREATAEDWGRFWLFPCSQIPSNSYATLNRKSCSTGAISGTS